MEFRRFNLDHTETPMTKTNMDLSELLAKHDQGDFLRTITKAVLQLIMEADVEGLIGAGRHERSGERTAWRNGYRERALDTRLGTLKLRVPKLRQGSYFPGFLEARNTSEQALVAVIQEAWIGGVPTRRVDDLVRAMGLSGISKSTVSKLCKDIDERVGEFPNRPLTGEWPCVWLDATYLKVRQGGRIVPVAAIIAVAAITEGRREIIGLEIGPSEAETFWTEFLRSLRARGLGGVRPVISDAHTGLKAAISRVFEATWQRCRVGLLKNTLGSWCQRVAPSEKAGSRLGADTSDLGLQLHQNGAQLSCNGQNGGQIGMERGRQPLEVDCRRRQERLDAHVL